MGRGTRTALKWGGIALAFLLVLGLVVGAWAYFSSSFNGAETSSDHARWNTRAGTWTASYVYTGVQSRISVDVVGMGLPAGAT